MSEGRPGEKKNATVITTGDLLGQKRNCEQRGSSRPRWKCKRGCISAVEREFPFRGIGKEKEGPLAQGGGEIKPTQGNERGSRKIAMSKQGSWSSEGLIRGKQDRHYIKGK